MSLRASENLKIIPETIQWAKVVSKDQYSSHNQRFVSGNMSLFQNRWLAKNPYQSELSFRIHSQAIKTENTEKRTGAAVESTTTNYLPRKP